jgi:alkanesulfonate monooxygenase SsuD/methylene tetrahydromethanopterin reductase-like flavin-dependent oxidoreductase (luciferase family)
MLDALRETFGAEPLLGRMGGSIPVTADFAATVADELVVLGFGLPDDGNHAPNERFRLEQFHHATEALLRGFAGGGRPEVVRHSVQSDSPKLARRAIQSGLKH